MHQNTSCSNIISKDMMSVIGPRKPNKKEKRYPIMSKEGIRTTKGGWSERQKVKTRVGMEVKRTRHR
jgi:hypothetical protein